MNDNERRQNELEFVKAAYESTEAWCTINEQGIPMVNRSLILVNFGLAWQLCILLPDHYPGNGAYLQIHVTVDETYTTDRKCAFQYRSKLQEICQQVAESLPGEEAIYTVLQTAETWIQQLEQTLCTEKNNNKKETCTVLPNSTKDTSIVHVLGRRLIYSHHIISKRKRSDLFELAQQYHLTGYMKIGWPGIILIEGNEEDCQLFYDAIRRWSWQYLVVRGEMQENCTQLEKARCFSVFTEVDDMSIVANHCREVGLEALFRTSMKVYMDDRMTECSDTDDTRPNPNLYGALVVVDHMNDGKSYRKWLRKTCHEHDVLLLLQQCYPKNDYMKRPIIIVGLVGENVGTVLKQWRTRKVDVDSKGKPCLERMMMILTEGILKQPPKDGIHWDTIGQDDKQLNTTTERIKELVEAIGGVEWTDALEHGTDTWIR